MLQCLPHFVGQLLNYRRDKRFQAVPVCTFTVNNDNRTCLSCASIAVDTRLPAGYNVHFVQTDELSAQSKELEIDQVTVAGLEAVLTHYDGENLTAEVCHTITDIGFEHFVRKYLCDQKKGTIRNLVDSTMQPSKVSQLQALAERRKDADQLWAMVLGVISRHRSDEIVKRFLSPHRSLKLKVSQTTRLIQALSHIRLDTTAATQLGSPVSILIAFLNEFTKKNKVLSMGNPRAEVQRSIARTLTSILYPLGDQQRSNIIGYMEYYGPMRDSLYPAALAWTLSNVKNYALGFPLASAILCACTKEIFWENFRKLLQEILKVFREPDCKIMALSCLQRLFEVHHAFALLAT